MLTRTNQRPKTNPIGHTFTGIGHIETLTRSLKGKHQTRLRVIFIPLYSISAKYFSTDKTAWVANKLTNISPPEKSLRDVSLPRCVPFFLGTKFKPSICWTKPISLYLSCMSYTATRHRMNERWPADVKPRESVTDLQRLDLDARLANIGLAINTTCFDVNILPRMGLSGSCASGCLPTKPSPEKKVKQWS